MKKKIVWLVVSCLMVAALLVTSCAPAVTEEKKVAPPVKEEKVAPPKEKEEVVVPEKKVEMVKWTGTKADGTVVEKMIEKPRYGGWYTVARPAIPAYFDQMWATMSFSDQLPITNELLLGGDYTRGPSGTGETDFNYNIISPALTAPGAAGAESWELLDGGTFIFHIRKGVHFALDPKSEASRLVNGREMTAEDWVFSLKRAWTTPTAYVATAYPWKTHLQELDGGPWIRALDKYTVELKSNPLKVDDTFETGTQTIAIAAREVIEKYGHMNDWRNLVGTGAFMLVDYVAGSSLTFARNPNYYMKDPFFPELNLSLPYIDGLKMLIIPDASTRAAALRTGKIDTLRDLVWDEARSLMGTSPELKWKKYYGAPAAVINYWLNKPELPTSDIKVRRALSMAIDRQTIVKEYYSGQAMIYSDLVGPLPENKQIFVPYEEFPEPIRELFEYHPEKARQLLAEAGYPKGFKTEVVVWSNEQVDLMSIVKDDWAKIGVDLEIQKKEYGAFVTLSRGKTYRQMITAGGGNYVRPYRWQSLKPGSTLNYSDFRDPYLDTQISLVQAAWPDEAKRGQLGKELVQFVLERVPYIALPAPYTYAFWQPYLKQYDGEWNLNFCDKWGYARYMWLDQDLMKRK